MKLVILLKRYSGKNLKKRHEKLRPDCIFVMGLSDNIPTKCLKLEIKRIDKGDKKTTKIRPKKNTITLAPGRPQIISTVSESQKKYAQCGQIFLSVGVKNRHIKEAHEGRLYTCEIGSCRKKYKQKMGLQIHKS